jgi:hypothetical protein
VVLGLKIVSLGGVAAGAQSTRSKIRK